MNIIKTFIYFFIYLLFSPHPFLHAQQISTINQTNIEELIEFSKNTYTDEIMLVHKNEVICHWENAECDSTYFNTASMVKSWTGLAIGSLIDRGLIQHEDDLVCTYLPQWKDGCKNQVTVKHLLTMSAGINRKRGAEGILAQEDMNAYAAQIALDTVPDIRFSYSNESVQLLGLLIESVTKKSANAYFQEALFTPLGMDSTRLFQDDSGNDITYGGATTTLGDALKIGMLMLNKGKYQGAQIISEEWIQKSLTPSQKAPYYGYLWWLDYNSQHKNFAATGDFGQMTIVFPDLELIYVRRQTCNKDVSGNMRWMGPKFLTLLASVVAEE